MSRIDQNTQKSFAPGRDKIGSLVVCFLPFSLNKKISFIRFILYFDSQHFFPYSMRDFIIHFIVSFYCPFIFTVIFCIKSLYFFFWNEIRKLLFFTLNAHFNSYTYVNQKKFFTLLMSLKFFNCFGNLIVFIFSPGLF